MSLFENSQNLVIEGGTFNVIGRDQVIDQSIHTHVHHHSVTVTQEADKIEHASASIEPPKVFDIPNSSTFFQGRHAELDKLKDYFKPRVADEPHNRRSLLLHGMGGIGKTQICLKFTEEAANHFSHIFWIDASTPETTSLGLKDISEAKSADSEGSVKSILQWISRLEQEWLLVFDNAEEHIHKFLPPGNFGNILMTSRNRLVGRLTSFKAIDIDQMGEDDAVFLLLKAGCLDQEPLSDALQSIAKAIVTELCCLPLAVDQAGASIQSGLCNVEDYLQLYSQSRKELLDDPLFGKASSYEQTVYGTWELSYKEIESRSARKDSPESNSAKAAILILQTFAFMHHENIRKDIFRLAAQNIVEEEISTKKKSHKFLPVLPLLKHIAKNIARKPTGTKKKESNSSISDIANHGLLQHKENGEWDELYFQNGIRMLLSFSLIKESLSNNVYTVHPLVHSWSQDRLTSFNQRIKCKEGKSLLSVSIPWTCQSEDYQFRRHLIPHIKANFQFTVKANTEENHIYNSDDCMAFGLAFGEDADWKRAEELYTQALNIRKNTLGPKHQDTLISMSYLASTYWSQKRWKEAEKLEVQVLNVYQRMYGPEHPETLTCMANLSSTYLKQGRWKEAEALQLQDLDICKRVLGVEHPDTLSSMGHLAYTYQNQQRWKEAEKLQVQVMYICKKVLGLEHPDTLRSIVNLAPTYRKQGRWKEAEKLLIEAVDLSKHILGEHHPDTQSSMADLASLKAIL